MAAKKQVIVVGGGGAGADVARALSQRLDSTKHEITMISPLPYMVYYVATLRLLVTDKEALEKRILIPYDKLFVNGNGTFKQGIVTAIEPEGGSKGGGKVILASGETVKYDVLALAPGYKWESLLNFPFEAEKVQDHIKEWRSKFGSAKKVVIAGGGAVGIELAGEIREFHPNTEVTIVHSKKKLLNKAYPDKYRLDVERRIRSRGVKLILDDFVETESEATKATTRKGVKLNADLVVSVRGGRPNTSWIVSSLGEDVADESGYLYIKPTLQLKAYPTIFALGDVIAFPEQKQIAKTAAHATVVASNITALLKGNEPKKEYKAQPEMIVLSMGSTGGAAFLGLLWGLMFGDWFTSLIKSKGLLIGMRRKAMGHPS